MSQNLSDTLVSLNGLQVKDFVLTRIENVKQIVASKYLGWPGPLQEDDPRKEAPGSKTKIKVPGCVACQVSGLRIKGLGF